MKKVVVSGATGFVAGWVIVEFLKNNYEVRGSVRSLAKSQQVIDEVKKEVSAEQLANLSFFEADLTSEKGWKEAIIGTDGVIHVASPLGHGTETVDEMVSIAKGGVTNIFHAAKEAGVTRIVMTSSQAASTPYANYQGTLDESFWSDLKNPELDPYRISKIEAEKEAWRLAKEYNLELSTIMPGAIFGPALSAKNISSNQFLLSILNGLPMIPKVPMEVSDVRDLGSIHRLAFEKEQAIGHRYLAASQKITMPEIAKIYHDQYPDLKVKVRAMPNWVTRLAAKFVPDLRSLVPMLDRKYSHSTKAAEEQLGWKQHAVKDTLIDAADMLIKSGLTKK